MKRIITIGGSSSRSSINKQLAEYVGSLLEEREVINLDLNDYELPLYSIDKEQNEGFPDKLMELNTVVEQADGFVISLAEHNGAYTAAFKNTFDWLSRVEAKVWRNKPVLLMATSPGARGGQSVLDLALSRFPYGGAKITGSLSLPSFYDSFQNGRIVNETYQNQLEQLIESFSKEL